MFFECPEWKNENNYIKNNKGKPSARVFALQHEEAPTVDTLAGILLIASHIAYAFIDTGVTYSCISEEFLIACGMSVEEILGLPMCVNTPLGPSSLMTEVVRSVDVELEGCHVPIDMLVLPISDFDVILGMNWLNLYCAIIDCHNVTLSFECNNTLVTHQLMRQ